MKIPPLVRLELWFVFNKNVLTRRSIVARHLVPNFGRDQFDHPTHSPDLAPCDFLLFASKPFLGGRKFNSRDELKIHGTRWLTTHGATCYEEGTPNPVPRYDRLPTNVVVMKKKNISNVVLILLQQIISFHSNYQRKFYSGYTGTMQVYKYRGFKYSRTCERNCEKIANGV